MSSKVEDFKKAGLCTFVQTHLCNLKEGVDAHASACCKRLADAVELKSTSLEPYVAIAGILERSSVVMVHVVVSQELQGIS